MSNTAGEKRLLDDFFNPESVAIIGLSRGALHSPVSVLTTLLDFGYPGRIVVVNPNMQAASEPGYSVCNSLDSLPHPVDVAIVSIAREHVLKTLEGCIQAGIRSAVVITQGLADADSEGARLQREMVQLAREGGLRIVGPNTIGVSNAFSRFTSSFIEVHHDESPVGIVSQSGLFMMGHLLVNNEPAGFSMSIDLGNSCDIDLVDVLEYYHDEPDITVIQCHLEGIERGEDLIETAARVGMDKPIIALKAGRTESGKLAVASHSGAAAGEMAVYQAAFDKAGIISASNAEELRLLARAFSIYRPPAGKRVAIMSFSGGGAILAIDAVEAAGLELAVLTDATKDALAELFPSWLDVDNPVDVWIPVARDFETAYPRILECLLEDEGVDAVICIYCSYTLPKYEQFDASRYVPELAGRFAHKPVLCWSYGMDIAGFSRRVERDGNTMVFRSLEEATGTLAKLHQYQSFREQRRQRASPRVFEVDDDAVSHILKTALAEGRQHLFTQAFEILERYGIPSAPWRFARDVQALQKNAQSTPYPVCMKVVSDDIVHKSDSGGIVLGISTPDELLNAHKRLIDDLARISPQPSIDGVLVQSMAQKGHEVMIGMRRDAVFGPCLVAGAGGVYTEVLADFAFRMAPLDPGEAEQMLRELRIAPILDGVRGEAASNVGSLIDILERISQLAMRHPEIKELDINPVIVNANGAVTVDARIIL